MNLRPSLTRILTISMALGLGLSATACDGGAKKDAKADTKPAAKTDKKADEKADAKADEKADAKADAPVAEAEDPPAEGGEKPAAEGGEKPAAEGGEKPAAEGGEPAAEGGEKPAAEGGEKPEAAGGDKGKKKGGDKKTDKKKGGDKKGSADKGKPDPAPEAAGADGKALYGKKCKNCHGVSGAADTKLGKKHDIASWKDAGWKGKWPASKIENIVTNGKSGTKMKPFKKKLTAAEIKAVSKYARSLGK